MIASSCYGWFGLVWIKIPLGKRWCRIFDRFGHFWMCGGIEPGESLLWSVYSQFLVGSRRWEWKWSLEIRAGWILSGKPIFWWRIGKLFVNEWADLRRLKWVEKFLYWKKLDGSGLRREEDECSDFLEVKKWQKNKAEKLTGWIWYSTILNCTRIELTRYDKVV